MGKFWRTWCVLIIACIPAASLVFGKNIPSFAGPYLVHISKAEDCPNLTKDQESHFYRLSHFNPRRPFETQTITGNVTVTETVDDTWWGSVTLDIRSNNQWKSNAFVINKTEGWCSMFRINAPDYFRTVFKQDSKSRGPCTIPRGTYVMHNKPLKMSFPNIPIMPYGHYRAHNLGGKGKRLIACYMVENHVIPRPK